MTVEPDVQVPMPRYYGSPPCPACGYRCGCCCHCECQGGEHEPWDCQDWATRYDWAKAKSERLARGQEGGDRE